MTGPARGNAPGGAPGTKAGARVKGNSAGLAPQAGGSDLARKILDELRAEGPCQVVVGSR